MITDPDIWNAAATMIDHHGENAETVAVKQIGQMIDQNDPGGQLVWFRIREAIAALQSKPNQQASLAAPGVVERTGFGTRPNPEMGHDEQFPPPIASAVGSVKRPSPENAAMTWLRR